MSLEGPGKASAPKPEKKVYEAALVDVSALASEQARDVADHKMTESKEDRSGNFLARTVKRIWKHNVFQEYYRQKEIRKANKDIRESGNLYAGEEGSPDDQAHKAAMSSIMERFTSEYENDTLRDEERATKLEMQDGPTNAKLKKLITDYAGDPTMTPAAFTEQRNRILSPLYEDYAKEGVLYADGLLTIATELRNSVEHGAKLDALDFEVKLTLGKARGSLNGEAKKNTFDGVVEKLQNSRVGKYVANESVALLAGAAAYSGAKAFGVSLLRSNVAKLVTFGGSALAAGGIAAAKESARLERERVQHMREAAKGIPVTGEGMKRREAMEASRYETRTAGAYIASLEQSLAAIQDPAADPAALDHARTALAEVESRVKLGDRSRADLISYSSPLQVEVERTKLDLLRAKLKVELRRRGASPSVADKALWDSIDQKIDALTSGEEGMEAKDKLFKKMKRRKVAGAALKTMAIGAGVGALFQEGVSAFDEHQTSLTGNVINAFRGKEMVQGGHATALESLRRYVAGDADPRVPLGHAHEVAIGANHVKLGFGPDGTLDEASRAALAAHDIHTDVMMVTGTKLTEHDQSAADFIQEHGEGTGRVHRELWYDNDSPHPFDKNELRTQWGGEHGTGIDKNGNYVLSMQHMTADGSYHHGAGVNAQDLMKQGKLKMLFSLSRGTQHQPFAIPVDKDGNIVIAKDSPIAKLMFEERYGKAVFTGKFGEVAQVTGTAADGGENVHILGTLVGKGKEIVAAKSQIVTHVPKVRLDVPDSSIFDMPAVIPVTPRRALERAEAAPTARQRIAPGAPEPILPNAEPAAIEAPAASPLLPYYGYGANSSESILKDMEGKNLPLDSYVKGPDGAWTDKEGNPVARDPKREQQRIQSYLERQEPDYLEELKGFEREIGPMNEKCRVAVTIPARFEEAQLGNLLDQYTQQVDESGQALDPDLFEINILVNRRQGEEPDKSMEIIREWKEKHPTYHVNAIDITLTPEKANVGVARKYLADLTVMRSANRTGETKPLYIESEDADLFGVDKRTVNKLIRGFDEKPHLDILRGVQDRQPEVMEKNDLLFFERRLWDFMEVLMRRQAYRPEHMKGSGFVWNRVISGGWNTAFTAESYVQIGGYVPDTIGEDMKIGQKISVLRGTIDTNGEAVPNTQTALTSGLRASSSPRRFLDAMRRQRAPYDDFEDQSLKHKSLDELLDDVKEFAVATPEQRGVYEEAINRIRNFVGEEMAGTDGTASAEVFGRVLMMSGLRRGVDYTYRPDGRITLTDSAIPRIRELISGYQDQKRHRLGYARQNSPLAPEGSQSQA